MHFHLMFQLGSNPLFPSKWRPPYGGRVFFCEPGASHLGPGTNAERSVCWALVMEGHSC
jgi:hypothetical protein